MKFPISALERSRYEGRGAVFSEADREMTRSLRERIAQRERAQHHVAILSGGTIAAAASVMVTHSVSPWLILGLALLLLAFSFAMLNNDHHIIASAMYIIEQDGDDAAAQRAWEVHLQREIGRSNHGIEAIVTGVLLASPYAVPVFGTLGSICLFLVNANEWQRLAVLVPMFLGVLFVIASLELRHRYWLIGEKSKSLGGNSLFPSAPASDSSGMSNLLGLGEDSSGKTPAGAVRIRRLRFKPRRKRGRQSRDTTLS